VIFSKIRNRIRLFRIKNKEPYLSFYQLLGFYPDNPELYEQAFLHRSIRSVQEGKRTNNERLEFLGDAILSAIIADILFKHFPDQREGFLTNTRSKIVKRESLNKIALALGIDKRVNSKRYAYTHNRYMWGNALEALIGAIYLDKGYRFTCRFVEEHIVAKLLELDKLATKEVNFKSRLLEWGQKNRMLVEFELMETHTDNAGSPVFQTGILLEKTTLATGVGNTKKESQQVAAKIALRKLKRDGETIKLVENLKKKHEEKEDENYTPNEIPIFMP
jgi:ribonuclease-3